MGNEGIVVLVGGSLTGQSGEEGMRLRNYNLTFKILSATQSDQLGFETEQVRHVTV